MIRLHRFIGSTGFACLALCSPHASAQALKLNPASFKESLLAQPPATRGGLRAVDTLVGVRAASTGPFDAANVRLGLGDADKPGELCVKMISRDGRYTASARYQRAPGKQGLSTLDIPTRHAQTLRSYSVGDISIQGYMAPDCTFSRATELVVTTVGDAAGDDIIVQVNAPASRVRAQFLNRDKPLAEPVLCEALGDGPRTGYTAECRLKAAAGLLTLVLTETTSTGFGQRTTYPIRVTSGGKK
jgi:hypothetical protein